MRGERERERKRERERLSMRVRGEIEGGWAREI